VLHQTDSKSGARVSGEDNTTSARYSLQLKWLPALQSGFDDKKWLLSTAVQLFITNRQFQVSVVFPLNQLFQSSVMSENLVSHAFDLVTVPEYSSASRRCRGCRATG
jgi:hypothetical protein